ncbi:nucleoside-diphosphate kinase [bacterium]|nr:nucleoside-diphosphate kinase [bacterium]
MTEQTLLIVKPDAVEKKLIGEIIRRVENAGYEIKNIRMLTLEEQRAEAFYKIHQDKYFFKPLIDFMISGPCVPVVVEGQYAISGLREMVGATDPNEAAEGTIRKDFATNGRRNAVHASDSSESAVREIAFFFDNQSE